MELGKFETFMQARDPVKSLHNFRKFPQVFSIILQYGCSMMMMGSWCITISYKNLTVKCEHYKGIYVLRPSTEN